MKRIKNIFFVLMFAFLLVGLNQVKADGPAISSIDGASIRVKTETSEQGLRFYAELNESVKNKEHGFYLVYGKATVTDLENALLSAGAGEPEVNNKVVYHVQVPGVNAENKYSVVLTGIPEVGYFDNISVFPYYMDGQVKRFAVPVTRSVAGVVFNMASNGKDVSKVEGLTAITETDKKKVAVNAFGDLEISSGVYELNHFNLREIFIADWNEKFGTSFVELDATEFWNSAKVGLDDERNVNKNLAPSNLYKFFNDDVYGPKWNWFMEYMKAQGGGIIHGARQAEAILGDGTNADQQLWHGDHLSHSIANFFNQAHEVGHGTAVNFTELNRYENLADENKTIFVNAEDYDFVNVGHSLVVPAAPEEKDGYEFKHYKAGASELQPNNLYVVGDDVVLKPVYEAIDYLVKFYDGETEMDLSETYNIEGSLTLPNPQAGEKAFRGWYDNPQFDGNRITKIDAGSTGNKQFYAKWGDGNVVTYNLGDYGYHTSEKTKEDLFLDFVNDYISIFGRTNDPDGFMAGFFAASFIPTQYKIEDIFTHENGRHEWVKDHILEVGAKTNYEGMPDLLENDQAAWRSNIEGFFTGTEARTGYSKLSIDFTMDQNAHNFWKHLDYGVYEEDFVPGGALFDGVKTDSKIYGFVGFVDGDGVAVTQLPAEAGDYELFAKWERSAFYVNFNMGYSAETPVAEQLVAKNAKVDKPADPVRANYTFAGWYKDAGFATAWDFNDGVTEEMVLFAKWDEVAAGAEYNINYVLDGGKIVYGTKQETIDAFLEDFYAYLKLDIPMNDFKHGVNLSSGYDGLWHSAHKEKIYNGPRPSAVNNDFFISSEEYMDKWLPFFDMMDEFIKYNPEQYFFGEGTSVGFIRIRQYIIGDKPAPIWPDTQMNMMPEPLIEAPSITKGNVGIEIKLQVAYKEGKTFAGWYTNADFSGDAVTILNPSNAEDVTLYAKFV